MPARGAAYCGRSSSGRAQATVCRPALKAASGSADTKPAVYGGAAAITVA